MPFLMRSACVYARLRSPGSGCWRPCMRAFEYAEATDLDEARALLNGDGSGRLLAGGTDLLPLMKADIATPERLIDIKHLGELRPGVVESDDGLTIGALTPLAVLEADPGVWRA